MAIKDFDNFNSQTKRGKTLNNLFLRELEKEAKWYRKKVKEAQEEG